LGNNTKNRVLPHLASAILLVAFGAMDVSASTLYNDIPNGYNGSAYVPYATGANAGLTNFDNSVPFDLSGVSEFGGLINLTGSSSNYAITSGTVALDNYATEAQYGATGVTCALGICSGSDSGGYWANVTVNAYAVGSQTGTNPDSPGNPLYAVGSPIASSTTNVYIDWSPGPSGGGSCVDGALPFNGANGPQCSVVNLVNFDLSAVVPASFIYTISVTGDTTPTGSEGPSDSLNLGLNPCAAGDLSCPTQSASTTAFGTTDPDTAYYNASCASAYGLGVCGSLQADTGWGNYGYGAVSFSGTSSTPEPATFGLIGFGLVALGISSRKRNRKV
jgi:hypothetical protein